MADMIKFYRGELANLPATGTLGAMYITIDEGAIYYGTGDGMKRLGDFVQVANISALPASGANENALYYCVAENVLAKWNGTTWSQINPDTGMTSVEISGEGNAVTAAAYSADGRKLTLTKGTTFATKDELDAVSDNVNNIIANSGGSVYQVTSESTDITVLSHGITAKPGDVLVATNAMGVKSGYHYDNEDGWVAMDGMVDASSVILKENITMAGNYTQVGNLTKSSNTSTATFEVAGKSVADALTEILSKREQPKITASPAVSLTFSQAKAYEVGTTVAPSYSASLSAGSYTYGPATGITATAWAISDTDGHTATTASGSFDAFTVGDNTSYKITATATHGAGAVAKDNLGSDSNPIVQIVAGEKSKTSSAVTGYRSYFYGVLSTSSAEAPLTSAIIRGMTNGGAYNASKSFTLNGNATAKRIVVAIPGNTARSGLSSVILTSAMNTPVTDSYVKTEDAVLVDGANGYDSIAYDVYVYEPAAIDAGEVHAITLA